MPEIKALQSVEIKNADLGQATVRFATYNEMDRHGDITKKGAFEDGAQVVVSAYNHGSWSGGLPVGKGQLRDSRKGIYADLQFFMNTTAGRDTFETVKEVGSLQEWSYGFDIEKKSEGSIKSEDGERETPVRYLEKVKVYEVSPVLMGAGLSTATVGVKSMDKLQAAGYSIEDIIELLEEKASKKPKDDDKKKPKDDEDDDKKKPKDSDEKEDDEDEEDDDKKKPKKPKSGFDNSAYGYGKLRMSDQTDDVVASIKSLADRAEEIVALRKSEGKKGVSFALQEQFEDLLKQSNRILNVLHDEDDELQDIYLSLLSEEL